MEVKCGSIMRRLHTTLNKQQDQQTTTAAAATVAVQGSPYNAVKNETETIAKLAVTGINREQSHSKATAANVTETLAAVALFSIDWCQAAHEGGEG